MLRVALFLHLLGFALAAGRLFGNGLYKRYPALSLFLAFCGVVGAIPLFFENTAGDLYFKIYVCTQPLLWMVYVLAVREIYELALASHRGLGTLGRWAMYGAIMISAVISLLSILPKITPKTPQTSRILGYVFAIDRGLDFALVLFILLILFFLSRYPVPLSRNLIRHCSLLFVYFLSNSVGMLVRTIYGRAASDRIGTVLLDVTTLVAFGWLFLIRPAGEEIRKVVGKPPEHEQRVLRQLDSLNAALQKISRD